MFRQSGLLFIAIICTGFVAAAQDTLPSFTLLNKGNNRIIISWNNPYGQSIHQLSIQRSADSTRNFKSILTLPDPTVPQNGFADTKAPGSRMFYRLYILLDSGRYIFSKSKRPVPDTLRRQEEIKPSTPAPLPTEAKTSAPGNSSAIPDSFRLNEPEKKEAPKPAITRPVIPERMIYIKKRDTLIGQIGEKSLRRFRDSLAVRTRDTLSFNTSDTIIIRPFVPKEIYRPSKYVYTDKDGNIKIMLPLAGEKKYSLRFFNEANMPVLEIKQIKESTLTLDKANFLQAGWFRFELYEEGVLKEKHKLFIPKDF